MIRNSKFRLIVLSFLLLSALVGGFFARDKIRAAFHPLYPLRPADPAATGLVGYWTFDSNDISGTTAIDRSGNGNNGMITGLKL